MADDSATKIDATGQILQWYSKLYSRRVDLVGDFAGSERFLVHGESLLLHCFTDPHIDFDPGYQLLHASYAVEKFLHGLISRCCNFHIAFFDDHQQLCVPQDASPAISEKYLLARAAIIRHLKANLPDVLPDVEIHTFPSITSPAFKEYLRSTDIYFVLCHDGASFNDIRKKKIQQKDVDALQEKDRALHKRQQQYKAYFRTLIYNVMQQGYSTALINGLEWRDTKVVTTVLEHARSMTLDSSLTVRYVSILWKPVLFSEESPINAFTETRPGQWSLTEILEIGRLRESLKKIRASCDQLLSEREYLTILVAANMTSAGQKDLSAALVYHTALLSELCLTDRSISSEMTISEECSKFILDFCREARTFIGSAAWTEAFAGHPDCDVADLIDGRLFAFCVQNTSWQPTELFTILQQAVTALAGQALPDKQAKSSTTTNGSSTSNNDTDEAATYSVLPFSNDTFDEHLAPIQLDVSRSGGKADQTTATIFREVTHWHNQRSLNQKSRVIPEKDPKIAKKALRRNQFFMAEMTSYAASLTNAVGKVLDPETITLGDKSKSAAPKSSTPAQAVENKRPKQQQAKSSKNINAAKQAMLADIAASSKRKDEDTAKQLTRLGASSVTAWRNKLTCLTLQQSPAIPRESE